MLGINIRKKIDENNKIISEALTPNFFTLNNTVSKLLEENRRLQEECGHNGHLFEDGYCVYCDMMEEKDEH